MAHGLEPELELLRGTIEPEEAARAAAIGLRMAETPAPRAGDVVVLDVSDVAAQAPRYGSARLLVIDDRDALASPAAVVVQPSQAVWRGLGPAGQVLAGYRYAPVGAAYRRLRAARVGQGPPATRRGVSLRVLACFGGSDPFGVAGRIAPSLAASTAWQAELVLGPGSADATDDWPIVVSRAPGDLPERLASADIALLGAGTIKFEAACLGIPSLLLAVADDQLAVGPPYAATGAAAYLGDGRLIEPSEVRAAIDALAAEPERRAGMAAAGWSTVDGDGADRVAEAVAELTRRGG